MGKLRCRKFRGSLGSHTHWVKGELKLIWGEAASQSQQLPHTCRACVWLTHVVQPEPGTTGRNALSPNTFPCGWACFLLYHQKGDRFSSLLHSISSLKFYSYHSGEGYSVMELTILHPSGRQGSSGVTLAESIQSDRTGLYPIPPTPCYQLIGRHDLLFPCSPLSMIKGLGEA